MAITYDGRKAEYIEYLGGKCRECGTTETLEIDHIEWQNKSFNVLKKWGSRDQAAVYAELDKCQLLCKVHHKMKTAKDANQIFTKPENHGSMRWWMHKKCKCDVCSAARREWYDARNERRRNADAL